MLEEDMVEDLEDEVKRISLTEKDSDEESEYDLTLPETMKAIFVEAYQQECQLSTEIEVPEIFIQNQAIVRVLNVGLNMFDAKIWNGDFGLLPTLYFPNAILGRSYSGVIVAVGTESKYEIGDEVFGLLSEEGLGTLKEFCLINPSETNLKPDCWSFEEAACIPVDTLAAWQALKLHDFEQEDQVVYVHGASGFMGQWICFFAKYFGAKVYASCRGENMETLEKLNVDRVINYEKEDFLKVLLKEETEYVSFFIDLVDDPTAQEKIIQVLSSSGTFVTAIPEKYVNTFGESISYGISYAWKKLGSFIWSPSYYQLWIEESSDDLNEIMDILLEEEMKVDVECEVDFNPKEITRAMKYLLSGKAKGKLVVKIE
eukprot:gene9406-1614_t